MISTRRLLVSAVTIDVKWLITSSLLKRGLAAQYNLTLCYIYLYTYYYKLLLPLDVTVDMSIKFKFRQTGTCLGTC